MQKDRVKRSHISPRSKIGSYGSRIGHLKKEKSFYFKFSMILIILIFLSTIYIWQRVAVLTSANEIKRINVKIGTLQKEYKYLQVEVASLSSVERIGTLAKEMGFVCPSFKQQDVLPEAPDSVIFEKQSLSKSFWAKLKEIQKNLLYGEGVEAKEVKHGL